MSRRNLLKQTFALESSLETEKLLEARQDAASGSDLGLLQANVKNQVDAKIQQRDNPVETSGFSSSSDSSSDAPDDGAGDGSADDSFDMDMPEDPIEEDPADEENDNPDEDKKAKDDKDKKDAKEDPKEDSKEATENALVYQAQTEELLTREFKLIDANLAREAIEYTHVKDAANFLWEGGKAIYGLAVSAIQALSWVGVNIGAPLARKLYKVIVYLSAKFIRFSYVAIDKVQKQVTDHKSRLELLRKDIDGAKGVIDELARKAKEFPSEKPKELTGSFKSVKSINRLKLGDETNPLVTAKILQGFLKRWYEKTSKDIINDSGAINQVLKYGMEAAINPVKTFGDSHMRKGLVPDNRQTHEAKNEFVDSLRYSDVLPGDMIYCAVLPNGQATTIDEVREAYQASSCGFAIEPRTFKRIEEIKHMDAKSLALIIVELDSIVKQLEEMLPIYNTILKERKNHLAMFKRFFLSLADSDKKITLEQSMLEYVYLRGAFLDNVYTVTARDIHRYTQGYVAEVMKFVKSNLVELSS